MFTIDSFVNIKQLFPSQCLETYNSEVAEGSAALSRGSLTEELPYGASEDKERFHRVSGLLELLRKLCFPHVAEQT